MTNILNYQSQSGETHKIMVEFDYTRYKIWGCIKVFLDHLDSNTYILEIGCGNGNNMLYRKDLQFYGIDRSKEHVYTCKKKLLNVMEANMTLLPYNNNIFNYILCISSYHHLANDRDRRLALNEMYRCLKPNGLILLSVFSMEQPNNSRFKFTNNDELVQWVTSDGCFYHRYYHIYIENELIEEINRLENRFIIKKHGYEQGNWWVVLQK
jgi:SAM-dependent methyltransferase